MAANPKKEEIIALALQGIGPTVIGKRLSIPSTQAYGVIRRARMRGVPIKLKNTNPSKWGSVAFVQVGIPDNTYSEFMETANRRGMRGTHLIREVLQAVADDDLYDAVLGPY